MKHEIIPLSLWRHRAPNFFPRYLDSKEERKRMFRDYCQTNKRETGLLGQSRDLHFVWFHLAQADRLGGRKAQAKRTIRKSEALRLEHPVTRTSPMAQAEQRVEIRCGHELLRRLRAGRR
jgi:transposase-like protein